MKKSILIIFILCSSVLYAETFQFSYLDEQKKILEMTYNFEPLNERPLAKVQWYNYGRFLLDQLDFDYETNWACVSYQNKSIDGRVEIYSDVIYFYPRDLHLLNDRYIIKIEFRFYGKCFRYDLDLEEKLYKVDVGTFWMEHDIIDRWELWKYDWIYQEESYMFDGHYERVVNASP